MPNFILKCINIQDLVKCKQRNATIVPTGIRQRNKLSSSSSFKTHFKEIIMPKKFLVPFQITFSSGSFRECNKSLSFYNTY